MTRSSLASPDLLIVIFLHGTALAQEGEVQTEPGQRNERVQKCIAEKRARAKTNASTNEGTKGMMTTKTKNHQKTRNNQPGPELNNEC